MRSLCMKSRMVKDCIYYSSKLVSDMSSSKRDYEDVVKALNSLQTNAALLQSYKKLKNRSHSVQAQNVEDTVKYLKRTGVTLDQLDELSVIHVSGTKGKGSTCALCESILRHHGLKTGFYSSPHLVAVRERIQINGKPLSSQDFAKYFWSVYEPLTEKKDNEHDMPSYFKFLTVLAFKVFLAEKVDVALVEVGIGGEYDCTNIMRKVAAVGITSLGMDHTSLLGNTIEEIAWQKAGIFKSGTSAFTVQQPISALAVLQKRAIERNCTLQIVPPLEDYDWRYNPLRLQFASVVQTLNASLALQLANAWLQKNVHLKDLMPPEVKFMSYNSVPIGEAFQVTQPMLNGLSNCSWPGRLQVLDRGAVTFCLDGAHTVESVEVCFSWFQYILKSHSKHTGKQILVFNATGERDVLNMLIPLMQCKFNIVIFCPNVVNRTVNATSDQANFMVPVDHQLQTAKKNLHIWETLQEKEGNAEFCGNKPSGPIQIHNKGFLFPCVSDIVKFIESQVDASGARIHVLVTGSLHLVGCFLSILDPELSSFSYQFSAGKGKSMETG